MLVSAINKTQITVTFEALTEALENYTFEVKDNNGKDVAVKEIAVLDVGETEATITFVTPLAANPAGKWTVNGVEFDADAQAAVEAVKNAGNEVALLNALKSQYFENVNEELISDYAAEDFSNAETVADVQEIIDEVNKDNVSADAVKKVREAKNQVELLQALQDGGFVRVNANLIKEYAEEDANNDSTADYTVAADADAVQAIIDAVNLKAAQDATAAADTTAATALTAKAIADAQALVNALPEKEDTEKADKKVLQDRLDVANAVAKVKGATTQASLLSALKASVLDLKNIDDNLAKFYKGEFDKSTGKAAISDVTYDLQDLIIDEGKKAAIADTAKKISEVTDKTSTADLKALLTELKRLDGTNFATKINDALLEDYRDALNNVSDVADKDETSEINTIINNVNDPTTAITSVTTASDEDELLDALNAKTLNLKNVKEANKAAYFNAAENSNGTSYFTKVTTAAETQKVVNAINAFVDADNATSATELHSALNSFVAIISDSFFVVNEASNYINLSSAAKLEVAEIVLDAKQADYVDAMDLAVAIDGAVTSYTGFLTGVNGATTISTMNTELDNTVFPAFEELSASEKVEKAEAVLSNLNELKAQDPATEFKTIAQIKAAAGL